MNARLTLLLCLLSIGCEPPIPDDKPLPPEYFGSMGEVMPALRDEWQDIFDEGETLSLKRFTGNEGLGPKFNLASCSGCHETPTAGGGGPLYRNFILMGQRTNSDAFLLSGTRGGVYTFHHIENIETEPEAREVANVFAGRNPIPFFGMGLISLVSDDDILTFADPEDLDGNGISGRANFISGRVGRLGLKAQALNIEGFVRGPLMNHLGITTNPLSATQKAALPFANSVSGSVERRSDALSIVRLAQVAAPNEPLIDDDDIQDPELPNEALFKLVAWATLLAPPKAEPETEITKQGRIEFNALGCSGCHRPSLPSKLGAIPIYSDLLLHDMGDELADGIEMGFATGREFRTAPLWGVGATGPYLHDGRALTLEDAITSHGGEALASAEAFRSASPSNRNALLEFLKSLGGRAQSSLGLIPPTAPQPGAQDLGGPMESLSSSELEQWNLGRTLFDRNFGFAQGLGRHFNGDSCRACHFLGAVGGAGPIDVDVQHLMGPNPGVRYEHSSPTVLPAPIPQSAFIERRNTPPLFGLNAMAQVGEDFLVSIADPLDSDQDGISGRVSYTAEMTVGRFGWRANIHSIRAFVEDALQNELGMNAEDGEHQDQYRSLTTALTTYLEGLAEPPTARNLHLPAVFISVGCVDCHRDDLPIEGATQPLTDLLLHDIGSGHWPEGDTRNDYRTPPLWALASSSPYLHDGRSDSLEDAILQHDGEAAQSRQAYEQLPRAQQIELVEFLNAR